MNADTFPGKLTRKVILSNKQGDDDMQRVKWVLAVMLVLLLLASGCGQKSAEDVVKNLDKKLNDLQSYKALGTMTIQTGGQPQEYTVETWFKEPYYYRIVLSNRVTNVTQIVLRNDDGVFVLDPSLNKSYRFKSDWPESNGAVYLFQSLANSIIDDPDRTFELDEENYLFEVMANYQNKSLSRQQIWLDHDLKPLKVLVFDPQETQLVEMNFTQFEFDAKFDDDAFDMERNLTGWDLNALPTIVNDEGFDDFGIIEPAYIPEGITKQKPKIVHDENGRMVIIKYTGEFDYHLIETNAKAISTSAPDIGSTDIVDLGYGIGVLTEMSDTRTLTWTYDGVEFKLTGDLPSAEMINVARSVFGQSGK